MFQTRLDQSTFASLVLPSVPDFFEGEVSGVVALPGQSDRYLDTTNEDKASGLKEKALQLYWKASRDGPGIVLNDVCYKITFRELKVGESGCYRVMVNPIVKPHFDREAIPKFSRTTTLGEESQGPDPLPNAGSTLWVT